MSSSRSRYCARTTGSAPLLKATRAGDLAEGPKELLGRLAFLSGPTSCAKAHDACNRGCKKTCRVFRIESLHTVIKVFADCHISGKWASALPGEPGNTRFTFSRLRR